MNSDRDTIVAILRSETGSEETVEQVLDNDPLSDYVEDSLELIGLVARLETDYDIEITDEEIDRIKTVKDLVDCVQRNVTTTSIGNATEKVLEDDRARSGDPSDSELGSKE